MIGDFENLDSMFNVSGNSITGTDELENQIEILEEEKNKLLCKSNENFETLEDKEYIQEKIKVIIETGETVLSKVSQDIKIGSNPKQIEVYAKLIDSVVNALSQLRELNKVVSDKQLLVGDFNSGDNNKEVNFKLTGKELLNMINSAKENSQLNAVDTDFEIEEIKEVD